MDHKNKKEAGVGGRSLSRTEGGCSRLIKKIVQRNGGKDGKESTKQILFKNSIMSNTV